MKSYVEKRNRAEKAARRVMSERKILCIASRSNLSSHHVNHIGPAESSYCRRRVDTFFKTLFTFLLERFLLAEKWERKLECLIDRKCESSQRLNLSVVNIINAVYILIGVEWIYVLVRVCRRLFRAKEQQQLDESRSQVDPNSCLGHFKFR